MTVAIPTVIVGTSFRGPEAKTAVALMRPGDVVFLEREYDNRHDPLAVACRFLSRHVGYIPRETNQRIAEALDAGLEVRCIVREPPVIAGPFIRAEPKVTVSWEEAT